MRFRRKTTSTANSRPKNKTTKISSEDGRAICLTYRYATSLASPDINLPVVFAKDEDSTGLINQPFEVVVSMAHRFSKEICIIVSEGERSIWIQAEWRFRTRRRGYTCTTRPASVHIWTRTTVASRAAQHQALVGCLH